MVRFEIVNGGRLVMPVQKRSRFGALSTRVDPLLSSLSPKPANPSLHTPQRRLPPLIIFTAGAVLRSRLLPVQHRHRFSISPLSVASTVLLTAAASVKSVLLPGRRVLTLDVLGCRSVTPGDVLTVATSVKSVLVVRRLLVTNVIGPSPTLPHTFSKIQPKPCKN
ncbi:hypothetical protein PIB30_057052 [Stylosanthes scabra]|uniref:Uncharacterized protein n=1 Tax=Stylosanthes scabra TaxID=79078 RepID=A0ABU6XHJ1_9FABA|nr:hypothetical protein [Stylosanthes scabra]